MRSFAESIVKPFLARNNYCSLCEVGAQFGDNTDRLLELGPVHVTVIDPCLDADLCAKSAGDDRVAMHKGLSLDVLPELEGPFDCILLDGDHNWYTVYHELKTIHDRSLLRPGGAVLLHDVSWPYGRRDMYFQPDTIPPEFRHPFAFKGIVRGLSELVEDGGANAHVANALEEGGPRNGVLTALEDFLAEHGEDYLFFQIDAQYGLGFLFKKGTREETAAFRSFQRGLLQRFRMGKLKDTLRRVSPALYDGLKWIRNRFSWPQ